VTYGERFHWLEQVLDACQSAGVGRVVVVDNASRPASRSALEAYAHTHPSFIDVLSLAENAGSAGGYKAGLAYAMEQTGQEYFWLLDDDNCPAPDTLSQLLAAFAELATCHDPATLAVCSHRPASGLGGLRPGAALKRRDSTFLSFNLLYGLRPLKRWLQEWRVAPAKTGNFAVLDIPTGLYGGLLVSRSLVSRIGLPDERFVLYCDDTDYTARIRAVGGRLFLVFASVLPDLEVSSLTQAQQVGTGSRMAFPLFAEPVRAYYKTRNEVYLGRAATYHPLRLLNKGVYILWLLAYAVLSGRLRQFGLAWRAMSDGERGKLGKYLDLPA
jgi:GT2 family glycosyltransferase